MKTFFAFLLIGAFFFPSLSEAAVEYSSSEEYDFTLEFPDRWDDFDTVEEETSFAPFGDIPTIEFQVFSEEYDGYWSLFRVSAFPKSEFSETDFDEDMQDNIFAENNDYFFYYGVFQDSPDDLMNHFSDIPEILNTFAEQKETPQICTMEYMPVCGEVEIQCITTPCDPIKETFGNRCQLEVRGATFLHEGVCEPENDIGAQFSVHQSSGSEIMIGDEIAIAWAMDEIGVAEENALVLELLGPTPAHIAILTDTEEIFAGAYVFDTAGSFCHYDMCFPEVESGEYTLKITLYDKDPTSMFGGLAPSGQAPQVLKEAESEPFSLVSEAAPTSEIPENCTSWFDGCNTCSVENGELIACTEMACNQYKTPECRAYKEEKPCTREYMPVCGQPPMPECPEGMGCAQVMPEPETYGNRCMMENAGAELLNEGECVTTGYHPDVEATSIYFPDVTTDTRFHEAIAYIAEKEYVQGFGDGTFRPEHKISRYEFIKIVVSTKYSDEEVAACNLEKDLSFPDVPKNEWFSPYVCIGQRDGIINGFADGTFGGMKKVTAPEALKMILETYEIDTSAYRPNAESWYKEYQITAAFLGLTGEISDALDHNISRAEMAELLFQIEHEDIGKVNAERIREYLVSDHFTKKYYPFQCGSITKYSQKIWYETFIEELSKTQIPTSNDSIEENDLLIGCYSNEGGVAFFLIEQKNEEIHLIQYNIEENIVKSAIILGEAHAKNIERMGSREGSYIEFFTEDEEALHYYYDLNIVLDPSENTEEITQEKENQSAYITEDGSLIYRNSKGEQRLQSDALECDEGVSGNGFKYDEVYEFDTHLLVTKLFWRCQSEGGRGYIILEKETGETTSFSLYDVFLTQFSKEEFYEGIHQDIRFSEIRDGKMIVEIWDLQNGFVPELQYDVWQAEDFLASEEEWGKVGIKSSVVEIPISDLK